MSHIYYNEDIYMCELVINGRKILIYEFILYINEIGEMIGPNESFNFNREHNILDNINNYNNQFEFICEKNKKQTINPSFSYKKHPKDNKNFNSNNVSKIVDDAILKLKICSRRNINLNTTNIENNEFFIKEMRNDKKDINYEKNISKNTINRNGNYERYSPKLINEEDKKNLI